MPLNLWDGDEMIEFTSEWIAEQKELLSGDSAEDILESALEHYPEALDEISRLQTRVTELEQELKKNVEFYFDGEKNE